MPTDFITVAALDEILEDHIDQFAGWLNGDTNYYHAANPKANDATNYLLDLQNVGSGGKALQIKNSSGTIILAVTNAGLGMLNNAPFFPAVLSGTPVVGGVYRDTVVHGLAYATMSAGTMTVVSTYNGVLTHPGTGLFTFTFATAPPNDNYTMNGMGGTNVMLPVESAGAPRSTAVCQFAFYDTAGVLTDPTVAVNLMVIGGT